MKRSNINRWTDDEKQELDVAIDCLENNGFENYCSACDNFMNQDECPFYGHATDMTDWKNELRCKKFYD